MIATLSIIGCGNNDDENPILDIVEDYTGITYNSKDGIHCYTIKDGLLYKREKENSKVIWSKQVITPPPITIDLGYGEKETIEYNYSYVTLDTDEYIYIYIHLQMANVHIRPILVCTL